MAQLNALLQAALGTPLLRSLTEHSTDVIMILDMETRIRFINRTAAGISSEQVLGTRAYDWVSEDQHPAMRQCFEDALERRMGGRYDTVYTRNDGEILYFDSRVVPIIHDDVVLGLVLISSNITDNRKSVV